MQVQLLKMTVLLLQPLLCCLYQTNHANTLLHLSRLEGTCVSSRASDRIVQIINRLKLVENIHEQFTILMILTHCVKITVVSLPVLLMLWYFKMYFCPAITVTNEKYFLIEKSHKLEKGKGSFNYGLQNNQQHPDNHSC